MAKTGTLDLAKVDPPVWRILVNDVVYGPYTLGQMRSFVDENRLSPQSKVAMGDGGAFMPASQQEELLKVFEPVVEEEPVRAPDEPANHVIVLKSVAQSRKLMLEVLNEHGRFAEVMPGVFVVRTATKTAKLRDALLAVSDDGDRIIMVNADSGRLAWLGLGDDISGHIHAVWAKKD